MSAEKMMTYAEWTALNNKSIAATSDGSDDSEDDDMIDDSSDESFVVSDSDATESDYDDSESDASETDSSDDEDETMEEIPLSQVKQGGQVVKKVVKYYRVKPLVSKPVASTNGPSSS